MLTPITVERGDGVVLAITWEDDRIDRLSAAELRSACPCAACQGNGVVPAGVTVAEVRAVGAYALGITFAPDGHATGIFPFEMLQGMRP